MWFRPTINLLENILKLNFRIYKKAFGEYTLRGNKKLTFKTINTVYLDLS